MPPTRFYSTPIARAWCGAIAILLPVTLLFAAPLPATAPVDVAPTPKSVFQDQVAALETDLAALLQRKPDVTGPELAMIDFQIDYRLIERWMLTSAIEAKPSNDELNACVALRAGSLQTAGLQLAQRLQNAGKALTPGQLDGLAKVHQLTYKLPEIQKIDVIDEFCRTLATALILASNPTPAEVKSLPPMRPQPFPGPPPRPEVPPRTLADLVNRANHVQVGPALKHQLLALCTLAAAAAAADLKGPSTSSGQTPEDAKLPYDMLCAAVDLSDGLEKNTGIDAANRPKVEQQLTEGLALFSDVRTRTAGKRRIASLSLYRESLIRVQNLHLPAAMQQKLAPAFVWINGNPESGLKVLESIEVYLQLCARSDVHKSPAILAANLKKTVDTFQKQFAVQRSGFLDDAADLGGAGILTSSPASLAAHIDSMRQILEGIDIIEKLPRATQVLTGFRPKPGGALDKRIAMAVADLAAAPISGLRDAAVRFLSDVERLAQIVDGANLPPGLLPGTQKSYTHGRMESVDTHRFALISSLASELAAGKDMDATDLAKLQTLREMFNALRLANDVEVGLARADLLMRWADWSINAAQLSALVLPYRDATAAAFEGFADDNSTPLFRWPDIYKRFFPILILIKEVGLYADQCTDLPTGLFGEFAKLLTPMANQPFATERNASLSVGIWQRAAEGVDAKTAETVFDAMLVRLRKDLGIE